MRKEDFTTHKFVMLSGIVGLMAGMISSGPRDVWQYFAAALVYLVVFVGLNALARVVKGKFAARKNK